VWCGGGGWVCGGGGVLEVVLVGLRVVGGGGEGVGGLCWGCGGG